MTASSVPVSKAASRSVRAARPADIEGIRHIEALAFEPSRRSSTSSLRRALHSDFQRVLVLESDGVLAGYVIVWPFPRTWRIYNLASDPGRRRQGIGSALIDAVVEAAERSGVHRVVLESRKEPALQRFYEERGFRARRELPDYYAEGEDAVRMELGLTGRP